jgi:hypothetical protein
VAGNQININIKAYKQPIFPSLARFFFKQIINHNVLKIVGLFRIVAKKSESFQDLEPRNLISQSSFAMNE